MQLMGIHSSSISRTHKQTRASHTPQDFSSKDYSKKDFSGAIAQKTNFQKSKFVASRFYKVQTNGAAGRERKGRMMMMMMWL